MRPDPRQPMSYLASWAIPSAPKVPVPGHNYRAGILLSGDCLLCTTRGELFFQFGYAIFIDVSTIQSFGFGVDGFEHTLHERPRVRAGEVLGSFCNFLERGERRGVFYQVCGEGGDQGSVGVESFQFFEGAVEGALDAGLVAG
jgi:hypothetical protein